MTVVIIFMLCMVCAVCIRCQSMDFINNHSFVFINGWPQSGTSLIQQFVSSCPVISTMTKKCEELLGKRCVNWNHEGQWLLSGSTRQFFDSGVMCSKGSVSLTDAQRAIVMGEWKQFWSLDMPYLAEKSPQSFLKTAMLRQLVEGARKVRFIVVLKNPVTLNIATPKNAGWMYLRSDGSKPLSADAPKVRVTAEQALANAEHFRHFMLHDKSNASGADCSVGWLPAMDTLLQQLRNDTNSLRDIRIVRYEQFERPNELCRAIFGFIFDSTTSDEFNQTAKQVCDAHFPLVPKKRQSAVASSGAPRGIHESPRLGSRVGGVRTVSKVQSGHSHRQLLQSNVTYVSESEAQHLVQPPIDEGDHLGVGRRLRLRNYQSTSELDFIPELVASAGRERVFDFLRSSSTLPLRVRKYLEEIDSQLRKFGYNLREWNTSPELAKHNLFAPWEFVL